MPSTVKTYAYLMLIPGLVCWACKHPRDYSGELITDYTCDSQTVYFQNTIHPLLQSTCGMSGCHDSVTHKAGINVNSYGSILLSGNNRFVVYNDPQGSMLYQAVATGQMPPIPAPHLPADQVQLIYSWIDQGALNNRCLSCDTSQYRFQANVWPIFSQYCTGCHQGSGGQDAITGYGDIVALVNNHEIPGVLNDPDNYLLMPPGEPLNTCQIQIIINWINDGMPDN